MFLFVEQLLANIDIVIQKWEGKQHEFVEYLKKKHHVTSLSDLRQKTDASAPPVKESEAVVKDTIEVVNEASEAVGSSSAESRPPVEVVDEFKRQLVAFYAVHNPDVSKCECEATLIRFMLSFSLSSLYPSWQTICVIYFVLVLSSERLLLSFYIIHFTIHFSRIKTT